MGSVAELHRRGVEVVWVRRGAAGSLLSTPDGEVDLPAPAVTPVDVTGPATRCSRRSATGCSPRRLAEAAAVRAPGRRPHRGQPAHRRPDLHERMAP
jgi:pseudouridine kinase